MPEPKRSKSRKGEPMHYSTGAVVKKVAIGIISRNRETGEDEYLLVSTNLDFGEFTGYYYPPGGHIKEGQREEDALISKIKSEIGIVIKPVKKLVETAGDVKDQKTYWWLCELVSGEVKIKDPDVLDAKYFTREEMEDINIWPATKKVFEDYIF